MVDARDIRAMHMFLSAKEIAERCAIPLPMVQAALREDAEIDGFDRCGRCGEILDSEKECAACRGDLRGRAVDRIRTCAASGLTDEEIASTLDVDVGTVRAHLRRLRGSGGQLQRA